MLVLHFVAIWQRYVSFKADKVFENYPKCAKMAYQFKIRTGNSTTFDTETSMKQILVRY